MNKPYIVCHMMTSVDGRIDCAMTEHLPGVEEYYQTLDSFETPTHLSGRVTAEFEMALPGKFVSELKAHLGREEYSKKMDSSSYEIVVDTKGSLLWPDQKEETNPLLIITSEDVSPEYLDYLDAKSVSWIATGKGKIDLNRACEILSNEFSVKRMAVVGGGKINAAFLEAGLLDEVSILIGAGIDGRKGMGSVFDGLVSNKEVTQLKLESVQSFESGAIWIKYKVK